VSAALILSGGQSARFGSDKSLAKFGPATLLERSVSVAVEVAQEVVVVGPWAPSRTTRVIEPERYLGPLSAVVCGLTKVTAEYVLVLAGDHPLLQPALLLELLRQCGSGEYSAVVPVTEHGPQPLVACYSRTALAHAQRLVQQGERSMQALLRQVDTKYLPSEQWQEFDEGGWSFMDVDTTDDLRELMNLTPRSLGT